MVLLGYNMNSSTNSPLFLSSLKKEIKKKKTNSYLQAYLHIKSNTQLCRIDPSCELLCIHNYSFDVPREGVVALSAKQSFYQSSRFSL